jgi:integrase
MKNTLIHTNKTSGGSIKLFSRQNGLNPASLYLEIYPKSTKKRHLEFLGLHLTGDEVNDTINIQSAKRTCINYVITDVKKDKPANFTTFINERLLLIEKPQSRKNGVKALKKLQKFTAKEQIRFADITDKLLQDFKTWLLTKAINNNIKSELISRGTADIYYTEISRFAKKARNKGYIPALNFDPDDIKYIGRNNTLPVTFTPEQIVKLQNTPFPKGKEVICKAGILEYECGQRFSDVMFMTWEGLQAVSDEHERIFNQIKTGNVAFSAFNNNLLNWIADGREKTGYIFKHGRGGLPKNHQLIVDALNDWCKAAGIDLYVGTHTFRRSFAKHLWISGADIYSISRLLGHK